mmetsp:Transcript_69086/g.198136  ORF Transcript_69086/g.198136 Transcript_69086/m.198136 type:complete len:202 (+) Transcript_69086:317-922(+)
MRCLAISRGQLRVAEADERWRRLDRHDYGETHANQHKRRAMPADRHRGDDPWLALAAAAVLGLPAEDRCRGAVGECDDGRPEVGALDVQGGIRLAALPRGRQQAAEIAGFDGLAHAGVLGPQPADRGGVEGRRAHAGLRQLLRELGLVRDQHPGRHSVRGISDAVGSEHRACPDGVLPGAAPGEPRRRDCLLSRLRRPLAR